MSDLTVISLGWGVQSFTLAAMSALGELGPVDCAIHSDTTHERADTYRFAAQWTPWLEAHGVPVRTVQSKDTAQIGQLIPGYTLALRGAAFRSGTALEAGGLEHIEQTEGQVRRQCTGDWKIVPLRQQLTALLAARRLPKRPGAVEQWIGISLDEFQRMRTSDVAYITHRYPLVERRLSRADCIAWLQAHGLEVPGKSACVFCPFHNARAWESLKREGGPDWAHAVAVDTLIRDARPPFPLFVHRKRVPLAEAITIPEDQGLVQADMFARPEADDSPCDNGGCFI